MIKLIKRLYYDYKLKKLDNEYDEIARKLRSGRLYLVDDYGEMQVKMKTIRNTACDIRYKISKL